MTNTIEWLRRQIEDARKSLAGQSGKDTLGHQTSTKPVWRFFVIRHWNAGEILSGGTKLPGTRICHAGKPQLGQDEHHPLN